MRDCKRPLVRLRVACVRVLACDCHEGACLCMLALSFRFVGLCPDCGARQARLDAVAATAAATAGLNQGRGQVISRDPCKMRDEIH
eukprot:190912-Pleurochrysis_carterae.AAC.1